MKYVVNREYGSFHLPDVYMALPDCQAKSSYDDYDYIRTDPKLIAIVESPDYYGNLVTICIPDEATDTYIVDYDGIETMLYVVNGLIYEV